MDSLFWLRSFAMSIFANCPTYIDLTTDSAKLTSEYRPAPGSTTALAMATCVPWYRSNRREELLQQCSPVMDI